MVSRQVASLKQRMHSMSPRPRRSSSSARSVAAALRLSFSTAGSAGIVPSIVAAMVLISSRANERVKQIRGLSNRHQREETGAFFAEGARLVEEAMAARSGMELAVVAPERITSSEQRLVAK